MNKEELLAYYQADPKKAIITLVSLVLGIILIITGLVFAFKESRSQPVKPAAAAFPVPPPEPFVFATNSVIPPADTTVQPQVLQIEQPADQPQVSCTLDVTTEPKTIDCTVEVPDEPSNVQPSEAVTEPTPAVVEPPVVAPVTPAVVSKPVVKPVVKPKSFGIAATLNNYDKQGGHKVCTQDYKDEHPGVSGKDKGVHVDEDCCIDPDEIPNLNCYYPQTDVSRMVKAMDQAKANIGKKLGSKYHK